MPDESGAHRLGPHVVGTRVVVRRILAGQTGPSGGPAMTDVLGICTAWGDGRCAVQPEVGDPVEIAIGDIVSGKPVPPRAPVRARVSPLEAQVRAGALFEDLLTEPMGEWLLRRSDRHAARRANSVLAMAGSGSVAAVAEWYAGVGRRPIAAVLPESEQDELFRSAGWVLERDLADTAFQISGVATAARAARAAGPAPPAVELAALGSGLVRAEIPARAGGIASYDRDWVGFRGIEVSPDHRRHGLGLAVMAALIGWGSEQGATTAYLQVTSDNAPALGLYEKLGFVTHHEYRYLTPDVS